MRPLAGLSVVIPSPVLMPGRPREEDLFRGPKVEVPRADASREEELSAEVFEADDLGAEVFEAEVLMVGVL